MVGFAGDEVDVTHGGGRGDRITNGVVKVEGGVRGLGELLGNFDVKVTADADVESEAVPEREGECLGVEHEAVAGGDDK